jgi:hypothetical protein
VKEQIIEKKLNAIHKITNLFLKVPTARNERRCKEKSIEQGSFPLPPAFDTHHLQVYLNTMPG